MSISVSFTAYNLAKIYKRAAARLLTLDDSCPLRPIRPLANTTQAWVEFHLARAYFTALFRPPGQKPKKHWYPETEWDAPIIALLLAELIVREE